MHASETADTMRDVLRREDEDGKFLSVGIPPATLEESQALREIDARRHEEMNPPSNRTLRRRQRKHWSDRDHALGV